MNEPKNDSNTTIEDIKKAIAKFRDDRGWNKMPPRDLAVSAVIEASELLELFQWEDHIDVAADREKIEHELADTINYLLQFALTLDIDVTRAVLDKLDIISKRYSTDVFNPDAGHNLEAYEQLKTVRRTKGEHDDE